MAKPLIFLLDNQEFQMNPVKLDRRKIYGWNEVVPLDENEKECNSAYIDQSGSFLIPKGGTALGVIDKNFNWVDSSELAVMDENGNKAEKIPSSFSVPIKLEETASSVELLDHFINSVYTLEPLEPDTVELMKKLKEGIIFKFPFNYRDSYDTDTAFLIEANGKPYILVGNSGEFNYIGLEETGVSVEDEPSEDTGDDIDFSMM